MLTREQVKAALEEVGAAAKIIGKKYGLDIVGNTASFSDYEATIKLSFRDIPKDGANPAQAEWNRFVEYYPSLKEDDFGKTIKFPHDQSTYIIVGCKPSARTNKIIIRSERGTEYVTSVAAVKEALGR